MGSRTDPLRFNFKMNFSIMSPLISFLLLIFVTVIQCNQTVRNEAGGTACGTAPHNPSSASSNNRGAQSHNIQLWTNGIVPYEITSYMNPDDRAVARRAMSDIEESTCIRFKEREGESAYIRISRACKESTGECIDSSATPSSCNPNECFEGGWVQSGLGQKYPSQLFIGKTTLSISDQGSIGLFIHEILHSLGVEHTQRRPDRDIYIDVKDGNIEREGKEQYDICPTCLTYDTPYDCMSVMHYRDWGYSKNRAPTMIPAPGNTDCDLRSPANVLTSADIELLNSMYQCRSGCCGSLVIAGKYFANGNYIKTNELHNNKPVYKHSDGKWCVFYGGFWKIEACDWLEISDHTQGYGWSRINAECPEHIGSHWRYYKSGGGEFPIDPSIVVKRDEGCCDSLNVVGKYFANGEYKKTSKQHNGRPVYKYTGGGPYGGWCIFFGGHWKIDFCNSLTDGDRSQGYGWSNLNAVCPGNIGPQWRYYSWSGGSGSGPVDTGIEVECM